MLAGAVSRYLAQCREAAAARLVSRVYDTPDGTASKWWLSGTFAGGGPFLGRRWPEEGGPAAEGRSRDVGSLEGGEGGG